VLTETLIAFCCVQDVKPGKARVITCLMEAMAQPNFGSECRAELQERQQAVKNDYRCGFSNWHDCVELVLCNDPVVFAHVELRTKEVVPGCACLPFCGLPAQPHAGLRVASQIVDGFSWPSAASMWLQL
jgi:hypothetical protein